MKKLSDILGLTENKKEDEHKSVFKETDPEAPFPNDTVSALKRDAVKELYDARGLESEWRIKQ